MDALGRWSIEEPNNNPLQNDLGLVLKVIVTLRQLLPRVITKYCSC